MTARSYAAVAALIVVCAHGTARAQTAEDAGVQPVDAAIEAPPPGEELPLAEALPPAVAPAPLVAEPAPPPPEATVQVTVRARKSAAERLQDSAEAVNVVGIRKARQQTADLGEVLARTQGIGIRREGGLGSYAQISLNGLQGDQIRMFVDGVPFELAGYPFGIANVPVNLVDRVEVYRGVVPIRFGVDALGGAINIVTDQSYETHLGASYQLGSFGVHRVTANGRYRNEPTGLVVGASLFLDLAENDFIMSDRELPAPDGSSVVRDVRRFHDAYQAYGAALEAGVVDQPWADRLLVTAFASTYDKELQHNAVMSVPYGEVTYGEAVAGASARYEVELLPALELALLANYSYRVMDFRDMATRVYRWTGEQGRLVGRERAPGEPARGEIRGEAIDDSIYEDALYTRAGLAWTLSPEQIARVAITPQWIWRIGDDHVPNRVDLLGLHDTLQQVVAGVEYELNVFDDRLSNIAFGKLYYLRATHEGRPERTTNQTILEMERDMLHGGGGDALRFRFADWILAKVSYEYATRLPRVDELFGNGVLIESNLRLEPERSHNLNVGPRLELKRTPIGDLVLDVNADLRDTKDLIVLLAATQFTPYANVADVRGAGIENALTWDSPGRYLGIDGSFTYQDFRNESSSGLFAATKGMRVPSRPYMFASWGVRARARELIFESDALEPFYHGRYVHGFDRAWDLGDPALRPTVPAQTSHSVGITYSMSDDFGNLACTLELDNLTDAKLFDVYGVQRPGRSFAIKVTGAL